MNICMIGAGSLGSAIGATLALGGQTVTFIDPYAAHIAAIKDRGLHLVTGPDDDGCRVQVTAVTGYQGVKAQDLVIVLVKSFATRQAVRQAKAAGVIGDDTLVMTIQNGMGNEEALQEELGEKNVIGAKTFVSGLLLEPGKVMAAVAGRKTVIGEMDGTKSKRIERLACELSHAGLYTVVSDNIRGMIWDKLFVNVATGAISAITGLTYGGLYEAYGQRVVPQVKETALAAVGEAMAVAKAYGVRVTSCDPEAVWDSAAQGQPASFKASILQSLERKMLTEIDFINGAVSREGHRLGVPTPVNDTLTACVKGIELRMGLED